MTVKERDNRVDCVKGILELLIVLEHNALITTSNLQIRPVINAFCVGCFLLLTFTRTISDKPLLAHINKYYKYIVTYFLFMTLATLLNSVTFSQLSSSELIYHYLMSIFYQSSEHIKLASGFAFFWFIPCLCSLYFLRFIQLRIGVPFLVIMALLTLIIGAANPNLLTAMPFGLHVAFYIYFIGFIYGMIHKRLCTDGIIGFFACFGFLFLLTMNFMVPPSQLLFAGIIPSIFDGYVFVYYLMILLLAIPGIYYLTKFLPMTINSSLSLCGRLSLWIYLTHQFYYVFFVKVLNYSSNGFIVYLMTILFSVITGVVINYFTIISNFFLPKRVLPSRLFR